MSKFEYAKLADAVAAEIASGVLKPGDRLPPQRTFAYERKIATSTASRVYTELLRRGLVVGEVGRGTFISGEARRGVTAPTEPQGARIDLEFNYPMLPMQTALIAKSLEGLNRPEALEAALRQATSIGTPGLRKVAAEYLTRQNKDWSPRPGADGVHRQRPAMHRGGPRRGGADRRPLRRRGPDLPVHQGHRRPARRHAGAAGDGRAWRASGRRAEGAPRSAFVGAVHSAHHSKSAGHDHAVRAPRRSVARGREARSHDHRRRRVCLSRRRGAAGRTGAGPLRGARQPFQEGGAGAVARLCRGAASPARERHGCRCARAAGPRRDLRWPPRNN